MKRISQRDMLQSEIARLTVELNGQKAEVERLKLMVKSITGGLDEAIETVHYLEAENALLRKVASIAWNVVETRGMSDVLLSELAGRLADWETWKEGAE